jgi:hypothetical protein
MYVHHLFFTNRFERGWRVTRSTHHCLQVLQVRPLVRLAGWGAALRACAQCKVPDVCSCIPAHKTKQGKEEEEEEEGGEGKEG